MKCPNCGKENEPIQTFKKPKEFFNHHHFKCSKCGFTWGANEELPRPPIPNPHKDLIDRLKSGDDAAIKEAVLKLLGE